MSNPKAITLDLRGSVDSTMFDRVYSAAALVSHLVVMRVSDRVGNRMLDRVREFLREKRWQ